MFGIDDALMAIQAAAALGGQAEQWQPMPLPEEPELGDIPHYAGGAGFLRNLAGRAGHMVGMGGPELVNLQRGSAVIPNDRLPDMGTPYDGDTPDFDAQGAQHAHDAALYGPETPPDRHPGFWGNAALALHGPLQVPLYGDGPGTALAAALALLGNAKMGRAALGEKDRQDATRTATERRQKAEDADRQTGREIAVARAKSILGRQPAAKAPTTPKAGTLVTQGMANRYPKLAPFVGQTVNFDEYQAGIKAEKPADTLSQVEAEAAARARGTASASRGGEDSDWMSSLVGTTRKGVRYLDVSDLTGKDKAAAMRYASQNDLKALGKDAIADVREAEIARSNIDGILTQLDGLLPKDARERLRMAPGIRLSRVMQSNEQRAAFNSWRTAAIRNLRATAGSKGLRLNQAEIELAVKNDIPSIHDTYGVALQKMDNVRTMLDNSENALLGSGRPATRTSSASPGGGTTAAPASANPWDWLDQKAPK